MKRKNAIVEDKRGSWFFFFTVIMLLLSMATINAQTFKLGEREYIQVDGQWYINEDGRIGDQVIPERIVIQLRQNVDITQLDLSSLNLSGLQGIAGPIAENFHVLKVPSNLDPFISAAALSRSIDVVDIEFNALGEWTGTPDDPKWTNQWNLKASKLNMPAAWDISTGSSSIILAIIDTGFEYEHEDLDGNIWVNPAEDFNGNGRADFYPYYVGGDLDWSDNDNNGMVDDLIGWDFYGDGDPYPLPDYDLLIDHHGTAVAGIAAAVTDNGIGVAGIAGGWHPTQGVNIMCLRPDFYTVDTGQGLEPRPYQSSVAGAVTYAYQNGAQVINLSLAYNNLHSVLTSAINNAVNNHDVVVVCSSGNTGGDEAVGDDWDVKFPASMTNTIAVGATESDDIRWNTVTENGSCYGLMLDLMAPAFVWTTDLEGGQGASSNNYYDGFGKTSAAAPHVAGLAALIRSLYPDMLWQKVKEAMTETAVDLGAPGKDNYYGDGRIDAYAALSYDYPPPAEPQNFHVEWVPTFDGWNPKLVWNANSEIDLDGYKLRRSLDWGPYITLADLSLSTTYYIDREVVNIRNRRKQPLRSLQTNRLQHS
ncbi:MAG: S8 family serine peptidase [Candidatus Marinimicrobia bacterium]|nr:S8 family serine peptidase [Candidatus Neomarinimicrobiota bacterium]